MMRGAIFCSTPERKRLTVVRHPQSSSDAQKHPEQALTNQQKDNQRVDDEAAAKFKKQGNVDIVELMDTDHITRCCCDLLLLRTAAAQPQIGVRTENRRRYSGSGQGTLAIDDSVWKTGMARGMKRGGTARQHYKRSIDGFEGPDGIKRIHSGMW